MDALQQSFAGRWLILGIGLGMTFGVASGFDAIGLALGTAGGIVAATMLGQRRA